MGLQLMGGGQKEMGGGTWGRRDVTSRTRKLEGPLSRISPITSHALLGAPPSQGRPRATSWIGLRLGSHESNKQSVPRAGAACVAFVSCLSCLSVVCGLFRTTWRGEFQVSPSRCSPPLRAFHHHRPTRAKSLSGRCGGKAAIHELLFHCTAVTPQLQVDHGTWARTWTRTEPQPQQSQDQATGQGPHARSRIRYLPGLSAACLLITHQSALSARSVSQSVNQCS